MSDIKSKYNMPRFLCLQQMNPVKCVYNLICNQRTKHKFEKLLLENGDPEIMKNKGYKLTLIIDQINRLKEFFQNPAFISTIDDYIVNVLYVKIILVSSDKSFLYNELCSISEVRMDKFEYYECNLSKQDLKTFLKGHNLNEPAIQILLQNYDNKTDVEKFITAYEVKKLNSNDQQKAFQALKKKLKYQQNEILRKINIRINNALLKRGLKLKNEYQNDQKIYEYLKGLRKKKKSKENSQQFPFIYNQLKKQTYQWKEDSKVFIMKKFFVNIIQDNNGQKAK